MNPFTLSVFFAFMLAKLTSLNLKFENGADEGDMLGVIITPVRELLESVGISNISAIDLINLGSGFEGTSHIINYLITFTPIFFLIFALFLQPKILISIFSFIGKKIMTLIAPFKGSLIRMGLGLIFIVGILLLTMDIEGRFTITSIIMMTGSGIFLFLDRMKDIKAI